MVDPNRTVKILPGKRTVENLYHPSTHFWGSYPPKSRVSTITIYINIYLI